MLPLQKGSSVGHETIVCPCNNKVTKEEVLHRPTSYQVECPNSHPDTRLKVHLVSIFAPIAALQNVPALPMG